MAFDPRYYPFDADGAVPELSGKGIINWVLPIPYLWWFFYYPNTYVQFDGLYEIPYDHFSAYRHKDVWELVLNIVEIPQLGFTLPGSTRGTRGDTSISSRSESAESKPQYLIGGYGGQFDNLSPATEQT